jgi:uncharacterized membrane protein
MRLRMVVRRTANRPNPFFPLMCVKPRKSNVSRAALGRAASADRAILGGVCLLFALLGNVMGKVRRNFFIGVRTPWALANERVWNATHRFAAKTFVLGGVIGFALTAVGVKGWLPFAVLMAGALIPVGYSLLVYKQLERRGEL